MSCVSRENLAKSAPGKHKKCQLGFSEAQGRCREAGSEGSVEQSRDPMDKNRIQGLPGRPAGLMTALSASAVLIGLPGRGLVVLPASGDGVMVQESLADIFDPPCRPEFSAVSTYPYCSSLFNQRAASQLIVICSWLIPGSAQGSSWHG